MVAWARVKDNIITNIEEWDEGITPHDIEGTQAHNLGPDHRCGKGDLWDGEKPDGSHRIREKIRTPYHVKREAARRINTKYPLWKQQNNSVRAIELLSDLRTVEQEAELSVIRASWDEIDKIRVASNRLEAMDPIPVNIGDDEWWT